MRPIARLAPLLLGALLTACGTAGRDTASESAPTVPPRDLAALDGPASWRGDLPCADCAGIRTTITLLPDGTFQRQAAWLGTNGGGDTIFTDIGRWTHAHAATRLTLLGSPDLPARFAADPDGALRQLDTDGNDITSTLNYRLPAVAEAVSITHPSRLIGAFVYMADAALFVECESGLQFPVDMSADYPALERAYAASPAAGGRPAVVRLRGHFADRPAMEGDGTARMLVVDSMDRIDPADGCGALRTQDAIAAGPWRLVSIASDSGMITAPADTKASFAWDRADGRFLGNAGCNQYSGRGVLRGTTVVGGPAISTKMFCTDPGVMAIEDRMLALLGAGGALRIEGDTLVWSRGPAEAARFVRP